MLLRAGAADGALIAALSGTNQNRDIGIARFSPANRALDAQLSSDKVLAIARKFQSTVTYPQGQLAASLNIIARMIAGGLPTRVYYASQGGFDTHAGQIYTHDRLLGELDAALTASICD